MKELPPMMMIGGVTCHGFSVENNVSVLSKVMKNHSEECGKTRETLSPRGISANLKNGGVFEEIPFGIFENRPAIYRRWVTWIKTGVPSGRMKKDLKWLIHTSAFTSTSFSVRRDAKN